MPNERWQRTKTQYAEGKRRLGPSFYARSLDRTGEEVRNQPKETVVEFLARGGHVQRCPSQPIPKKRTAEVKPGYRSPSGNLKSHRRRS